MSCTNTSMPAAAAYSAGGQGKKAKTHSWYQAAQQRSDWTGGERRQQKRKEKKSNLQLRLGQRPKPIQYVCHEFIARILRSVLSEVLMIVFAPIPV